MSSFTTENLQTRVSKYFEKISDDANGIYYKCLIAEKCVKPLNGKKPYNLVCHAKTHKDFHREKFEMKPAELLDMPAKRLRYIQACTEFVTINGQPFAALNKSGFKKLNSETLQALKNANHGAGLGPKCRAVKEHMKYLASEIIRDITAEVKGKFISLMVDTATKYRRSILGISLQFLRGSSTVIRSIGMINLTSSHSAENIATKIFNQLKLFDIQISQIISVTTDNGTNMVAMVNRCNAMYGEKYGGANTSENSADESENDDDDDDESCNGNDATHISIDELQKTLQQKFFTKSDAEMRILVRDFLDDLELEEADYVEHEHIPATLADATIDFESLIHDLEEIFANQTLNISGIRCAAHTLQLAVIDALKKADFQNLIRLCKVVCKELRKQSTIHELDKNNLHFKIPSIDCITRWNSTYKMVIFFVISLIDIYH